MPVGAPMLNGRAIGVILAAGIVFSPVVIAGLIGYGAFKGIQAGAAAAGKAVQGNSANRIRYKFRRMQKRILEGLGKDTLEHHIAVLTSDINSPRNEDWMILQRASLYFAAMRLDDALADLNCYILICPENPLGHFFKGYVLSIQGNWKIAHEEFVIAHALVEDEVVNTNANTDVAADGTPVPSLRLVKSDVIVAMSSNKIQEALSDLSHEFKSVTTVAALKKAQELLATLQLGPNFLDAWRVRFMQGVVEFSLYCQDEKTNQAALQNAEKFLKDALQLLNGEVDAETLSLLSQVMRLKGDNNEADTLIAAAKSADPDVFTVDHTDHEQLVAPWPMPLVRPDGAIVHNSHEWAEKTFHKPTWCEGCGKFVRNSMMRHDAECRRCGARVHVECKDQVKKKCLEKAPSK